MSTPGAAPRGAYVELHELIGLRLAAQRLAAAPRVQQRHEAAGPRRSMRRGRGIDFEEVRAYQPGDDIRTIDWRVTARTSKPHTRVFREERERPVLLLVDQRRNMFFGSRSCCKSVQAAHLAALIAWLSLHRGDLIGALVFGDREHSEIRPHRSRHTVLRILQEIHRLNRQLHRHVQGHPQAIGKALLELRRAARPGTTLFLISDFQGLLQEPQEKTGKSILPRANEGGGPAENLRHLHGLAQHCEITALRVADLLEEELPGSGDYAFTDGVQHMQISPGEAARKHFSGQQERRREGLRAQLAEFRIPLIETHTGDAPEDTMRLVQAMQRGQAA